MLLKEQKPVAFVSQDFQLEYVFTLIENNFRFLR